MPRQERERRYIAEFMVDKWPEGGFQLNVELGPIPQDYVDRMGLGRAAALFRPTRPRVDAVKWTPEAYYLIEAKIRDIKAGIGDLMYYGSTIPLTPDLPNYKGQPIIRLLVVPWMLDWLAPVAAAAGVQVEVFEQEWIRDYVRERKNYFTAEYRNQRDEKMRLRKALDVE